MRPPHPATLPSHVQQRLPPCSRTTPASCSLTDPRCAVQLVASGFSKLVVTPVDVILDVQGSKTSKTSNPRKPVDPKVDVSPRCGVQLLGGMAKGLALLTVDQEYINRFRARPGGQRQRVLWGIQAAGVGLYEGLIGRAVWGLCRGRESRCLQPVLLPAVVTVWWLVWQPAAQGIVVPGYTGLWFAAHSDCRVALTR